MSVYVFRYHIPQEFELKGSNTSTYVSNRNIRACSWFDRPVVKSCLFGKTNFNDKTLETVLFIIQCNLCELYHELNT